MVRPEGPGFPEDVRRFWAEINGEEYIAYDSLEQAKRDPDGVIVLSGDYGTTVFLTAPAHLVRCDAGTLVTLVSDLDAVSWMSGDPAIATVAFERHPIGTSIFGGWGGGIVADGVWTNPRRLSAEIRAQAEEVVLGRRRRTDGNLLRRERDTELARKRESRTMEWGYRLSWDFDISPPAVPFPD
jgi:hypothetical protein